MTPKRKLLLKIAVAFVLVACIAGVIATRSTRFQIAYHDWQMRRAFNSCFRPKRLIRAMRAAAGADSCERFEYHRRRLILLGTVNELKFRLQHIRDDSLASDHIRESMYGSHCPALIYWEYPPVDGSDPVELTVWCYSQDAESWNRYIAARDVPDYETRFMDAGKSLPVGQ
jgi:hypothetical protein